MGTGYVIVLGVGIRETEKASTLHSVQYLGAPKSQFAFGPLHEHCIANPHQAGVVLKPIDVVLVLFQRRARRPVGNAELPFHHCKRSIRLPRDSPKAISSASPDHQVPLSAMYCPTRSPMRPFLGNATLDAELTNVNGLIQEEMNKVPKRKQTDDLLLAFVPRFQLRVQGA
jgi:hypothetical protein